MVVRRVTCYDKIWPWPCPYPLRQAYNLGLHSSGMCTCITMYVVPDVSKPFCSFDVSKTNYPYIKQNPQPQNHENLKTHTALNLQCQHSFHIIVCMYYSIWPLGLAAQNLTSVTSHHLRNDLLKNNMPHNPFYDKCLSIQIIQHPSQQRIMKIIKTLHKHTWKHRSWQCGLRTGSNGRHSF